MIKPHQSEAYAENETLECGCPIDGDERCESCCDHDDIDETTCLECGADMTEQMMADAYDRAKDLRKYGDVE